MKPNDAWRTFIRDMNLPDHPSHQLYFLSGFAAGMKHTARVAVEESQTTLAEIRATVDFLMKDQDGAVRA